MLRPQGLPPGLGLLLASDAAGLDSDETRLPTPRAATAFTHTECYASSGLGNEVDAATSSKAPTAVRLSSCRGSSM